MAKKKRTEALYEEISKVGKLYPYSTDKDTLTEEIAEANIDLHNSESLRKHSAKVIETKNAITKMRNKEIETLVSEASMHNIEELSLQQEIENHKKELKDIREYEHKYDYRYRQFSRDALIRKISDMDSKLKLESKLRGEAQTEVVERGNKLIKLEKENKEFENVIEDLNKKLEEYDKYSDKLLDEKQANEKRIEELTKQNEEYKTYSEGLYADKRNLEICNKELNEKIKAWRVAPIELLDLPEPSTVEDVSLGRTQPYVVVGRHAGKTESCINQLTEQLNSCHVLLGKKQIELEAVTQELIRTEKELERETKRATRRKRFIDENILPAKQQDNYDRLLLDLKNFLAQLMEAYNG
jgi:chromosome segregation ATPase